MPQSSEEETKPMLHSGSDDHLSGRLLPGLTEPSTKLTVYVAHGPSSDVNQRTFASSKVLRGTSK